MIELFIATFQLTFLHTYAKMVVSELNKRWLKENSYKL